MSKKHMGSNADDFLKEEDIFEGAQAQAVKEATAWQLAEAMKKKTICLADARERPRSSQILRSVLEEEASG